MKCRHGETERFCTICKVTLKPVGEEEDEGYEVNNGWQLAVFDRPPKRAKALSWDTIKQSHVQQTGTVVRFRRIEDVELPFDNEEGV